MKLCIFYRNISQKYLKKYISVVCCIFPPAFGCYAPQTLVEICIFNVFPAKKRRKCKKATNFWQNFAKICVFEVCTKMMVSGFIPRKKHKNHGVHVAKTKGRRGDLFFPVLKSPLLVHGCQY